VVALPNTSGATVSMLEISAIFENNSRSKVYSNYIFEPTDFSIEMHSIKIAVKLEFCPI
jgi:hypothetical protein